MTQDSCHGTAVPNGQSGYKYDYDEVVERWGREWLDFLYSHGLRDFVGCGRTDGELLREFYFQELMKCLRRRRPDTGLIIGLRKALALPVMTRKDIITFFREWSQRTARNYALSRLVGVRVSVTPYASGSDVG